MSVENITEMPRHDDVGLRRGNPSESIAANILELTAAPPFPSEVYFVETFIDGRGSRLTRKVFKKVEDASQYVINQMNKGYVALMEKYKVL